MFLNKKDNHFEICSLLFFLFFKNGPLKLTYFMYLDLNITLNLKTWR